MRRQNEALLMQMGKRKRGGVDGPGGQDGLGSECS